MLYRAHLFAIAACLALIASGVIGVPEVPAADVTATAPVDTARALPLARGRFEMPREPAPLTAQTDVLELRVAALTAAPPVQAEAAPAPLGVAALAAAEPTPVPTPSPTPRPTPVPTARPTLQPTPRPATPAPVSVADLAAAEQRTLLLMNASRAAAGLHAYVIDPAVSEVARLHSAAEAAVGYVYHDGPDGTAFSRNRPACGTGWWSENTGKVWNWNVDVLHREFMAEPWAPINHRTNIMDANFRRVGIGAVIGPDAMYLTVVFCR